MSNIRPEPYIHCLVCDEAMQGLFSYDTTTQRVFCWHCQQVREGWKKKNDQHNTMESEMAKGTKKGTKGGKKGGGKGC